MSLTPILAILVVVILGVTAFVIAQKKQPKEAKVTVSGELTRFIRSPIREPVPEMIAFVDVETTGLYERNRVVSLGAIKVCTSTLSEGASIDSLYLVFDPEEDSYPKAREVHGFSDWDLMHQDKFSERANEILQFLAPASLLVAHNAEFDFGFLGREFERCGLSPLSQRLFCTLEAFRAIHPGKPASLNHAATMAGGARLSRRHSALEDATLAMQVFFWLHGRKVSVPFGATLNLKPSNLRPVPEMPPRPPEPKTNPWAGLRQADFYSALEAAVKAGDVTKAEQMLLATIELDEFRCYASRNGVRYRPYLELAKLYGKNNRNDDELAVVQRYFGQSMAIGPGPKLMSKRLAMAEKRLAKTKC